MSPTKMDRMVRMANQIGAAFGAELERDAAANAARHLRLYWTPKMIGEIIAFAESGKPGLSPRATDAVRALKSESVG